MKRVLIETTVGSFAAQFSERGLARLEFPSGRRSRSPMKIATYEGDAQLRRWIAMTQRALNTILAGQTPAVLPPLDLSAGTEFQRAVWEAMKTIPTGATQSYGQIAAMIGRPKAVRAVGQACGANPIPVLIPCHRVLAAHGRLGGFSGGLDWKLKLLAREGLFFSGLD